MIWHPFHVMRPKPMMLVTEVLDPFEDEHFANPRPTRYLRREDALARGYCRGLMGDGDVEIERGCDRPGHMVDQHARDTQEARRRGLDWWPSLEERTFARMTEAQHRQRDQEVVQALFGGGLTW